MIEEYYDEKYFAFQRKIGEFGGEANLFKFEKYIKEDDDVMDFGCGGGYLLKNINSRGKKIGVEINSQARKTAEENGISDLFSNIADVPDSSVDIIISNHALEHVDNPVKILNEMKRCLRVGGKAIVVVPHEVKKYVNDKDINMHLYTWSPQNLRNLFVSCGFSVRNAKHIDHSWPPHYLWIQKHLGWAFFHFICKIYSRISNTHQSIVIAEKNTNV